MEEFDLAYMALESDQKPSDIFAFCPDKLNRKRPSLKRWDTVSTQSALLLVQGQVDASKKMEELFFSKFE